VIDTNVLIKLIITTDIFRKPIDNE